MPSGCQNQDPTLADGRRLVLASSSPFRRELLARLGLPFTTHAPAIDEAPLPGEAGIDLARRLAALKARAVATREDNALVIGSDQVALREGTLLGKPGTAAQAVEQLLAAAGKAVRFYTGLCLLDVASGREQLDVVEYAVHFRSLSRAEAERYVAREQPLNCAGSFKSEGLGIVLFERLVGDDPTSLIGLPLIRLSQMLRAENVAIL